MLSTQPLNIIGSPKISDPMPSSSPLLLSVEEYQSLVRQLDGAVLRIKPKKMSDEQSKVLDGMIERHGHSLKKEDPYSYPIMLKSKIGEREIFVNLTHEIEPFERKHPEEKRQENDLDSPIRPVTIHNKKIGAGGFGEVRKVTTLVRQLDHTIRTKTKNERTENERVIKIFFDQENYVGSELAKQEYDTTVGIEETGVKKPYKNKMVMRLKPGESLSDIIDYKTHLLTLEQRFKITRQIILELEKLHLQGVVHRDMNPRNINIDLSDPKNPRVYIFDFGLSIKNPGNRIYALAGTPKYIAPECKNKSGKLIPGRVTQAHDVYALGEILYELWYLNDPLKGSEYEHLIAPEGKIFNLIDKLKEQHPKKRNQFYKKYNDSELDDLIKSEKESNEIKNLKESVMQATKSKPEDMFFLRQHVHCAVNYARYKNKGKKPNAEDRRVVADFNNSNKRLHKQAMGQALASAPLEAVGVASIALGASLSIFSFGLFLSGTVVGAPIGITIMLAGAGIALLLQGLAMKKIGYDHYKKCCKEQHAKIQVLHHTNIFCKKVSGYGKKPSKSAPRLPNKKNVPSNLLPPRNLVIN